MLDMEAKGIHSDQGAFSFGDYRFGFVEVYVSRGDPLFGCIDIQTRAELGPIGGFDVPISVGTGWAIVILAPILLALFTAALNRRFRKPA